MQSPVIVALDFETKFDAMDRVRQLGAESRFYKVGLQIYSNSLPMIPSVFKPRPSR